MPQFEQRFIVRIPVERVAVLIGRGGETRSVIEEKLGVDLKINSEEGLVEIRPSPQRAGSDWDPSNLLKARDIVEAIGLGFSPQRAFELLSENNVLSVINLTDYTGRNPNNVSRIKARIIGSEGKTRRIIEETAHVFVTVGKDCVSMIGHVEDVRAAQEAIEMLINGAPHSAVYRFLDAYAQRRKLRRLHY
jgi:ribosomal RNA assembly protein